MSQVLINEYLADLDRLKKVSGESREGIVSEAFKGLLKGWGRQQGLSHVPQFRLDSLTRDKRWVDGALLHELRVPFGCWEAKDSAHGLDAEIARKFKRGYPQDNIIFEDSREAVLIQRRQEVMRCEVGDVKALTREREDGGDRRCDEVGTKVSADAGFPEIFDNDSMEAQSVSIALHDESGGYPISPERVPLAVLRRFTKDVDDFLRGGEGEPQARELEVAVKPGSLVIQTVPTAAPGLLRDLRSLAAGDRLDRLAPRRRIVVEGWQRAARAARGLRYELMSGHLAKTVVIDGASDFHADDADQWVRVERYVQGEVFELGGLTNVNAHIRLPDGKSLLVNTRREVLSNDPHNRLFKQALVRIVADFNIVTREHRNAELIEFVAQDGKLDERALARLIERGTKAWADVPDAVAWVEDVRGNDA